MSKRREIKTSLIAGLVIMLINLYWVFHNLFRLYAQNSKLVLYMFPYPGWVLILNSIIGLIGLWVGIKVVRQKIKIKYGALVSISLLVAGGLIKFLIMM